VISTLQVIRRFVFSEWGGIETVVWNTAQQLQRSGNPVAILATKALDKQGEEKKNEMLIQRFSYVYPLLNLTPEKRHILDKKGGDPYSWSLYNYMLKAEGIDMIHCHTMNHLAASVRLAARKRKIPYLVSLHGGYFDVPAEEMELMIQPYKHAINYGKLIDLLFGKGRYLSDADAIICVGYNEYEMTCSKYPDKLVYYLPNGVDLEKFGKERENDFREKYQIPAENKMILCLSRLDYQKNQEILVQLIDRLNTRGEKAHLVLVGPVTSEGYYKKITEAIKTRSLEQQVTIIKGLQTDDDDLVKAYQSADVFILPSIHEPFGIVVLEAWASGLPVITSNVGGLKRLVQDGKNGLIFDGTLEDLENKYLLLMHNKDLLEKIKQNAEQEVSSEYSWASITKKLLCYYREIIDKYRASQ